MSMTDEEVFAVLAGYGVSPSALPFVRTEPQDGQPHPGDRVFRFPVVLGEDSYLAVAWSFGQPDPDEMLNWHLVWHSVDGPMTRDELEALGRE